MLILGIDPGIAITGYGLIKESKKIKCLTCGSIETNKLLPRPQRLKKLYLELSRLINKYNPDVLAIENIYFFKNLKTAMPVSEAKGVILLAAAKKNIQVYEFTPLQVKSAIVGYGRAEKKQIQRMVKILLDLKELPRLDDTTDALAIALTYYFQKNNKLNSYKKN